MKSCYNSVSTSFMVMNFSRWMRVLSAPFYDGRQICTCIIYFEWLKLICDYMAVHLWLQTKNKMFLSCQPPTPIPSEKMFASQTTCCVGRVTSNTICDSFKRPEPVVTDCCTRLFKLKKLFWKRKEINLAMTSLQFIHWQTWELTGTVVVIGKCCCYWYIHIS